MDEETRRSHQEISDKLSKIQEFEGLEKEFKSLPQHRIGSLQIYFIKSLDEI